MSSLKPWREVAFPHHDVLEETFRQSDFNVDITAVRVGKAPREYQEAAAFFDRTFITEGMAWLLTQVARRLVGHGGESVIRLQTSRGGGKTHAMLAAYHLVTRRCTLTDLIGIPELLDQVGIEDVPHAHVAVLDGAAYSPSQHWKHNQRLVRTLWGELAWQLGGAADFSRVLDADATGTTPSRDVLWALIESHVPCMIVIDNLVHYVQQFPEGQKLSGGSYDSNLSFINSLVEIARQVSTVVVLASLPEIVPLHPREMVTLHTLEKIFGPGNRWKPVTSEEIPTILQCRLFEPIRDATAQNNVCRAFAELYADEEMKFPIETQESHYFERLTNAYPFHPEIFDRFYANWTLYGDFPRIQGLLKLMAKIVLLLWKENTREWMILPGSLPLHEIRDDLTRYLPPGWDAVIERDIDGEHAETIELENRELRFVPINVAHRVARTIFFGSIPATVATEIDVRGLDRAHILLGCLQPGQAASIYLDALNQLAERLRYLNRSSDKIQDATRFWFEPYTNPRREMADRERRVADNPLRIKIAEILTPMVGTTKLFDGVHFFAPPMEIPDDSALRLVILPPQAWYSWEDTCPAFESLRAYLPCSTVGLEIRPHNHSSPHPRQRINRLLFLAAEQGEATRITSAARVVLAADSLLNEVRDGKINLEPAEIELAEKELKIATESLPRVVRDGYRWLLCPEQKISTDPSITISVFALNTTNSLDNEIERICIENDLVFMAWSPIHLRAKLKELYWTPKQSAIRAMAFWEDTLRFLYLPRLKNRDVLAQTIKNGAGSRDFFGTAYGQKGEDFEGFHLGNDVVQLDNTLLLIEPATARAYEKKVSAGIVSSEANFSMSKEAPQRQVSFHGVTEVPAVVFAQFADKITHALVSNPFDTVKVTIEISPKDNI